MPRTRSSDRSRREFCVTCLRYSAFGWATVSAVRGGFASSILSAQTAAPAQAASLVERVRASAATAKIAVHALRGNVSVLSGSGGNIAVLTGRDGKVLVDAGLTGSRPQITEALATLGPAPVKHLVNTHWHFDHTDGNAWLHTAGAKISAHENVRKRMSQAQRVDAWGVTFPPAPADALPADVFPADRTLDVNATRLAIRYYGPCHTDGDVSVTFTDADILHAGDTWWNGMYPFIDYSTGGSINGMIRAAGVTLGLVTEKTQIVPGHGPVGDRTQLSQFRDMLVTVRDKVAALKKEGRTLDEIVAAKPTAAFDAKWSRSPDASDTFTRLVYQGV